MRTVEQVSSELKKAETEAKQAQATVEKYRKELLEIYNAAKEALGIQEFQPR